MSEYVGYCIQEGTPTPDKPCEIKTKVIGKNLLEPVEYLQQKEIERLQSIIKEVREYIKNKQKLQMVWGTITLGKESQKELLDILDKEK